MLSGLNLLVKALVLLPLFLSIANAKDGAQSYKFKTVTIKVFQKVTGKEGQVTATLETFQHKKKIATVTFDNIEALGGTAGITTLKKQPFKDLFCLSKAGSYDERILCINHFGKIYDFPEGDIYKDKVSYYFLRGDGYESEDPEGKAYNIRKGRVEEISPEIKLTSKSLMLWDIQKAKWIRASN